MDSIDWALLMLRTGNGLVILAHGVNHLRGRRRTTAWFESIGFRQPGCSGWLRQQPSS
jgi:putative oxidoreductase